MTSVEACVVGGTRGLGAAITANFCKRGLTTATVSRTPRAAVADARATTADYSQETHSVYADIGTADGIAHALAALRNCTGLRYLVFAQRYRGTGDTWDGEMRVGPAAVRTFIDALEDMFARQGDRAIVVVSSVYADYVGSSQPVGYHAAKAAMNQLTRYYAATLGRRGIRVNAVMPLTYLKPETRVFREADTKRMNAYRRFVPLGRLGTADESADAVDFLCSEKAGFISGQCLRIDGGLSVVWQEEIAIANDGATE